MGNRRRRGRKTADRGSDDDDTDTDPQGQGQGGEGQEGQGAAQGGAEGQGQAPGQGGPQGFTPGQGGPQGGAEGQGGGQDYAAQLAALLEADPSAQGEAYRRLREESVAKGQKAGWAAALKALAEELGFDGVDAIKAAVAEGQEAKRAQMSREEALADELKQLKAAAAAEKKKAEAAEAKLAAEQRRQAFRAAGEEAGIAKGLLDLAYTHACGQQMFDEGAEVAEVVKRVIAEVPELVLAKGGQRAPGTTGGRDGGVGGGGLTGEQAAQQLGEELRALGVGPFATI